MKNRGQTLKGTKKGEFDGPHTIDVDPEGNIFVAETYNQRVQKLSSNGEFLGYIGNKFFSVDTPEDLQKLIHATANDKLISRYRN